MLKWVLVWRSDLLNDGFSIAYRDPRERTGLSTPERARQFIERNEYGSEKERDHDTDDYHDRGLDKINKIVDDRIRLTIIECGDASHDLIQLARRLSDGDHLRHQYGKVVRVLRDRGGQRKTLTYVLRHVVQDIAV